MKRKSKIDEVMLDLDAMAEEEIKRMKEDETTGFITADRLPRGKENV